jgi:hypothetical protein
MQLGRNFPPPKLAQPLRSPAQPLRVCKSTLSEKNSLLLVKMHV